MTLEVLALLVHCYSVCLQTTCECKLAIALRALKVITLFVHCLSVYFQTTCSCKTLVAYRALEFIFGLGLASATSTSGYDAAADAAAPPVATAATRR
jgi:hypothetical protein